MECFTDDTKMGIELHSGEKLNMVSNLGVNGLQSKHSHAGVEHSKRICRNHPRHYPQCCLQLVFEGADLLLQILDFGFFDPQQDLWEQKPASLHLSRNCMTPAVPSGSQAGDSAPCQHHKASGPPVFCFSQENSSWFSWGRAQACSADLLPAHPNFCPLHGLDPRDNQGLQKEEQVSASTW